MSQHLGRRSEDAGRAPPSWAQRPRDAASAAQENEDSEDDEEAEEEAFGGDPFQMLMRQRCEAEHRHSQARRCARG